MFMGGGGFHSWERGERGDELEQKRNDWFGGGGETSWKKNVGGGSETYYEKEKSGGTTSTPRKEKKVGAISWEIRKAGTGS